MSMRKIGGRERAKGKRRGNEEREGKEIKTTARNKGTE
jgi:hypothetical protein